MNFLTATALFSTLFPINKNMQYKSYILHQFKTTPGSAERPLWFLWKHGLRIQYLPNCQTNTCSDVVSHPNSGNKDKTNAVKRRSDKNCFHDNSMVESFLYHITYEDMYSKLQVDKIIILSLEWTNTRTYPWSNEVTQQTSLPDSVRKQIHSPALSGKMTAKRQRRGLIFPGQRSGSDVRGQPSSSLPGSIRKNNEIQCCLVRWRRLSKSILISRENLSLVKYIKCHTKTHFWNLLLTEL